MILKNVKHQYKKQRVYKKKYNKYLNLIRKENKTNTQKRTLLDINALFNARDMAIKFIEDYS